MKHPTMPCKEDYCSGCGSYDGLCPRHKIEQLQAENHELLLADTKNTEICEKFEAQLIQANLDIIRLEKRNESMHEDYDALVEIISDQTKEISGQAGTIDHLQDQLLTLKSNQNKFSG